VDDEFPATEENVRNVKSKRSERAKLRIGDDWNAIRIIARAQSNPL
jgi:hypothetical protein